MSSSTSSLLAIVALVVALLATLEACSAHSLHRSALSRPQDQSTTVGSAAQVSTSSGRLIGIKSSLGSNNSIYKFLSVPYARAPIGKLRFRRPVELAATTAATDIDASKFGRTCPQFRHLTRFVSPLLNIDQEHQVSEDCLHLNVFVPSSVGSTDQNDTLEPNKQLPVIVWIPGEGFDFADARQFDGSHLAHKTQSIVVTVQYRVGVLGFLSAPNFGITGNMGIYDQLSALKWVQRNIASFGGDHQRVTLMGRFSGSMSISAIITAPNRGLLLDDSTGQPLFSRVAMLSGVAVDQWIIDSHQTERVHSIEKSAMHEQLCTSNQTGKGSCLQDLPIEQLLPLAGYGWRLVVDNELIGKQAPIDAIKANQFAPQLEAVLIGETGQEGTLCLYRHLLNAQNSNFAQLIEEDRLTTSDLYNIIRDDSHTYFRYNLTELNPIQSALESLVEDDQLQQSSQGSSASTLREKYLNACSSFMVKSHLNRFKRNILARNQLEENRMVLNKKSVEVFHYELKYKPSFSLAPDYIKVAAHGDDIPLIFGLIHNQPRGEINESDLLVSRKMMSYIGNFVHGNNPLLNQHPTIDIRANSENETTSMDESETSENSSGAPSQVKRNWSSESQVFSIDINEREMDAIINSQRAAIRNINSDDEASKQSGESTNVRVFVVARPTWSSQEQQQHSSQLIDISEPKNSGEPTIAQILPFYRLRQQQQVGNNNALWFQQPTTRRCKDSQPQQPTHMNLINESPFMTMLLFSSCVIIFVVVLFCLGFCWMVLRYNLASLHSKNQHEQKHRYASSSSTCNICDDSQGTGSLEAVLVTNPTGRKVDSGRSQLTSMFAKLRHPSFTSQQTGCHSTMNRTAGNTDSTSPATTTVAHPASHNHRSPIQQHPVTTDNLAVLHRMNGSP